MGRFQGSARVASDNAARAVRQSLEAASKVATALSRVVKVWSGHLWPGSAMFMPGVVRIILPEGGQGGRAWRACREAWTCRDTCIRDYAGDALQDAARHGNLDVEVLEEDQRWSWRVSNFDEAEAVQ